MSCYCLAHFSQSRRVPRSGLAFLTKRETRILVQHQLRPPLYFTFSKVPAPSKHKVWSCLLCQCVPNSLKVLPLALLHPCSTFPGLSTPNSISPHP